MSGIIGHSMYALLGLKAAAHRKLALAGVAQRHFASYLAGAYLGSDIQVMPEAVCLDTGREVGFGTVPVEKSPITGGAVRQFKLATPSGPMSAVHVHERFYGRSHLVFGFTEKDKALHVPWDHLPDYIAAVLDDAAALFGSGERTLAYVLGWIVHVVSDSLIKGKQPGIELNLVDGRYTAKNRPVQDLITFHEIGIKELHLDWPAIFRDMADTPVETVQLHYMRCAEPRGRLGSLFSDGWLPDQKAVLRAVLAENRRWLRHHSGEVLLDMELRDGECSQAIRQLVGMNYPEMLEAAGKAGFRHMLWQMGDQVAGMFEAVSHRSQILPALPENDGPGWDQIIEKWKRK